MSWFSKSKDPPRDPLAGMNANAIRWVTDFRTWHSEDEKQAGRTYIWRIYVSAWTLMFAQLVRKQWSEAGATDKIAKLDSMTNMDSKSVNVSVILNFVADERTDEWRRHLAAHSRDLIRSVAADLEQALK
jgi:hypothetical protein